MGETLSARVSHLEMTMNGSLGTTNMKCSGLCVCTGTGSTSWNMSINRLPSTTVAELLRLLNINTGIDKEAVAKEIASQYNKNLIFDPGKNLKVSDNTMISCIIKNFEIICVQIQKQY